MFWSAVLLQLAHLLWATTVLVQAVVHSLAQALTFACACSTDACLADGLSSITAIAGCNAPPTVSRQRVAK
jgi:hypothetical protein